MALDVSSVTSTAVNVGIMILTVVLVGGFVVGGLWLYFRYKKYSQFKCVIFRRDGFGHLSSKVDSAGIFVDSKTKNKRFFMKRANVGINPDKVPFIPTGKGKPTVYLYQTGLKNFHFINIRIKDPKISFTVGEEDVNWAINAYERQKKLFSQSLLMQLMPFILLAFVSIIILTMFIYFFKEFATLKDMAISLKDTAKIIAQASTGTTVVSP